MLRNRAYLGEIYFRDRWHKAPHAPLVDAELFARVQALLAERGDDLAARAANPSDYLATGKLRCGRCSKRYVGAAAHGNRYRYRYYICFSRQRYGPATCPADRLPTDELDRALMQALLATLARSDLLELAAANLAGQLDRHHHDHQAQLASVQAELRRTDQALDRYMLAFEDGKLDPDRFGARVDQLAQTSRKLQQQHDSLLAALQQTNTQAPPELLAEVRATISQAIDADEFTPKKALVSALVQDIEVRSRSEIYPTFRVPTAAGPDLDETAAEAKVRKPVGLVGAAGLEPATDGL